MTTPIPQPPALPILGNLLDVDAQNGIQSLCHLADKYGPIFKLNILGRERYFVSGAALVAELCDEKRFEKIISGALEELRPGIGSGLFTARGDEHDWHIAHRTLVPAFGPLGIKEMFDEMYDIATQLVAKWARMGPDSVINVTDDYTRLTLDSIALCAMDKRFNSFYKDELHPFVGAMVDFLVEGGRRVTRTRIESLLNKAPARKFQEDINLMKSVAAEVIEHRRANPSSKKDLLNAMLFGKDPKTGERLSDESIMNNMLTFLIAGHETTSGMLSFTTYHMLKNPAVWQKGQKEVDTVIGKGPVKYEHLSKLPYIEAILREALRLQPTAPAFTLQAKTGTTGPVILGGEYALPTDAIYIVLLPQLHKNPTVYGSDAGQFKPERMYGESFTKLPPGAWKPFGNGARACIGRPFAWQEAILVLALILQNFNLRPADSSYDLKIKQTLTLKPDNFSMYARLRDGVDPITLERKMFAGIEENKPKQTTTTESQKDGKPLTVLYGGNAGTCEGLAQTMASRAASHGFSATVKPLDAATDAFPVSEPVVIISASYEGNPPDNSASFVEWLKVADRSKFNNAQIAVCGCGHQDWATTYQKVPMMIETELLGKGARSIVKRGEVNVAKGTIFDDFDAWMDGFWSTVSTVEADDDVEGLDMDISTSSRASHLRHSVHEALVSRNEPLTKSEKSEKRQVEFKLPTNMSYEAGDYLAVLPINNMPTISRVLSRFGLPWDASMKLRKGTHTTIPTEQDIPVTVVLGAYVELSSPATKRNTSTLIRYGADENQIAAMSARSPRSVLELLEALPDVKLPFSVFLSMLTPMRTRQYSISSSPLTDPTKASITFSVVNQDGHLGVATNYLRQLRPGTAVQLAVRKSHASFHLPTDDSTPIIMIAAGTGIAPFLGFVEERAAKISAGKTLGEAALFIGCRDPTEDRLYATELAKWEAEGVVKLYYAYSRAADQSEGCKYAQDRLWLEREQATRLFSAGARAYICGSSKLGEGVADTVARIFVDNEMKKGEDRSHEAGLRWWNELRNERYSVDVFD